MVTPKFIKNINSKIYFIFFGHNGMEAFFLDSFLDLFEDGYPKDNLPPFTGDLSWTQSRVEEKLINDKFLKRWGINKTGFVITAEGKLHLDNGGYKRELIHKKLSRYTAWISVISAIISIWALIRTF